MSLDVYLDMPSVECIYEEEIFIRENGSTKQITRDEWNRRYPEREPITVPARDASTVFKRNITHNLCQMAREAGIYKFMWCPEENGITHARQLIDPLTKGLELLESDSGRFKEFNPSNGWGNYEALIDFVRAYIKACEQYPDATVYASR